ncbi:MAG: hypothetical protein QM488_17105 [Rhizobiaceae bacterium]
MRNNTGVERFFGKRNVLQSNDYFSRSDIPEKAEIIIEHRASTEETLMVGGNGIKTALDLFLPRDNTKRDHIAWAYFKACVTGFAISIMLVSFISGSNAPGGFTSLLFLNFVSGMVMMTMAPFMLLPIRILADVFQFFSVKRGVSDVSIGLVCGSMMMLPEIVTGDPISPISLCFILGGAAGGFAYWRYRGYPQTGDIQETSGEPSPVVQRF